MIKSILGGKSKNLCDVAYLLTLPLDKTLEGYGYLRVLINAKPNTTYTFSRQTANQINIGTTYLAISAYDDYLHNHWLNHDSSLSSCNKSVTLTTNSDGKLWIMFSGDVYSYWQKNLNPFGYIQLEKGSTATEYVPHELTSYKSIMKVSDVCQLVDKSKFPNTLTKDGITLTNNGDGSITLNGTTLTTSWYSQFLCNINTVIGHKYALIGIEGGMDSDNYSQLYRLRIFNLYPSDFTNPNITTATSNICSMHIQVMPNLTVNNLNCKPQLFDLTEMFRAGNEPKTVAEFKAKFPNDYYPYSPSCFVTSFDEKIICNSKDGNKYV